MRSPDHDPSVAIDVLGVSKTYGGGREGATIRVLDDVSLTVRRGEFVCIVGPSGCGKSTLLAIIGGFVRPSAGSVRVDGRLVEGPDPLRIFVFQECAVFPWLTVRENVAFGLSRLPREERERVAQRSIEMVGLAGFERAYPHQLSGGMRQRVEIARALAADPDVLYMDEPFASLDFITRLKMRADLIGIWQAQRKTVLFVTHDIEEAVQLADTIVVMGARPATVAATIRVDLPRPRDLDAPEYLHARDEVFRVMGMSAALGGARRDAAAAVVS